MILGQDISTCNSKAYYHVLRKHCLLPSWTMSPGGIAEMSRGGATGLNSFHPPKQSSSWCQENTGPPSKHLKILRGKAKWLWMPNNSKDDHQTRWAHMPLMWHINILLGWKEFKEANRSVWVHWNHIPLVTNSFHYPVVCKRQTLQCKSSQTRKNTCPAPTYALAWKIPAQVWISKSPWRHHKVYMWKHAMYKFLLFPPPSLFTDHSPKLPSHVSLIQKP